VLSVVFRSEFRTPRSAFPNTPPGSRRVGAWPTWRC